MKKKIVCCEQSYMMVQHVYCACMCMENGGARVGLHVLVNILISVVLGNLISRSKKHIFHIFSTSES